jgi:hypothetical protein
MAVIEIRTFRLADPAGEPAFLDADRRAQVDFCYQQPGLVRRTTARGEDGGWIVITLWQSASDADAAADRATDDPATAAFDALVDTSSARTDRFIELE